MRPFARKNRKYEPAQIATTAAAVIAATSPSRDLGMAAAVSRLAERPRRSRGRVLPFAAHDEYDRQRPAQEYESGDANHHPGWKTLFAVIRPCDQRRRDFLRAGVAQA